MSRQDVQGAVAAILVVVAVLCMVTTTMQPAGMAAQEQPRMAAVASKQQVVPMNATECEKRLDAMDNVFDYQRDARRRLFAGKNPPKTGPTISFDPYEPEAVCLTEERFGDKYRYGSLGDGPKYVCGIDTLDPKDCLVYNVGSNNQIAFEQAASREIGCEIHTFDPTLIKDYIGYNYSHFYPWGLGKENQTIEVKRGTRIVTFQAKSIPQIVRELGHTERRIDILKIDCEGCEYEVMPVVFKAIQHGTMPVIHQIQIELHRSKLTPEQMYANLKMLFGSADDAGYRIFHKERNHWGCHGYACVEYSLVHKSFLRKANAAVVCDHEYSKVTASKL